MCRHPIDKRNIVSAHDVDKAAKESYPEKYAKRMGEYRQWVKNREVVFEVGNTAEMRREEDEEGTWRRWWDWEFYINEINGQEGRYIQRVEVDLRLFFGNNPVLTRPPFRVSRVGWGTFNIKFTVHWR